MLARLDNMSSIMVRTTVPCSIVKVNSTLHHPMELALGIQMCGLNRCHLKEQMEELLESIAAKVIV